MSKGLERLLLASAIGAVFALSACAVPMAEAPSFWPAPASFVEAPPAPLVQTAGEQPGRAVELDSYAWLDRSDALLDAIGDSPPDYTFGFEGAELYAWTVGEVLVVEEPREEGYTLYLYDSGYSLPFFVRTPSVAAGFDGRELAVVYTRTGTILAGADARDREGEALALQRRGEDIYAAARRYRGRSIDADAWAVASLLIESIRLDWDEAWDDASEWERYRERIEARAAREALQQERRRRREAAERFRQWRDSGFAGPAPAGVNWVRTENGRIRRDRDGDGRPDVRRDRERRRDRARDATVEGPGREGRAERPDRPREETAERPNRPRDRDRPRDRPRRAADGEASATAPALVAPPQGEPLRPRLKIPELRERALEPAQDEALRAERREARQADAEERRRQRDAEASRQSDAADAIRRQAEAEEARRSNADAEAERRRQSQVEADARAEAAARQAEVRAEAEAEQRRQAAARAAEEERRREEERRPRRERDGPEAAVDPEGR